MTLTDHIAAVFYLFKMIALILSPVLVVSAAAVVLTQGVI